MADSTLSKWLGGPNFIKIRRGSPNGKQGGSHSGTSRKRIAKYDMAIRYADLMANMAANVKARRGHR